MRLASMNRRQFIKLLSLGILTLDIVPNIIVDDMVESRRCELEYFGETIPIYNFDPDHYNRRRIVEFVHSN